MFTNLDDQGEVISYQCSELPFEVNFDVCPSIELIDNSFLVVDDQVCDYIQQITIKSNVDIEKLELIVRDCELLNSSFLIENLIANEDRDFQFEISNSCGCEQLLLTPKIIQNDQEAICGNKLIPIERIDFLPFPLELEKFDLVEQEFSLFAEWKTLFEIILSEFIIEYSFDGFNFEELFSVDANQAENDYRVEIPNVEGYFRLKVINQNGEYGFTDLQYHKPTFEFAFYDSRLLFAEPKKVQVYSTNGQRIMNLTSMEVDLNTLEDRAMYFIFIDEIFFQKYFKVN